MSELDPPNTPRKQKTAGILRSIGRGLTLFRNFVLNAFFLLVLILILVAVFSGPDETPVPDDAVLVLNPAGVLVEQSTYTDPFSQWVFSAGAPIETPINDVLNTLEFAATDDRVKLLLLDFSRLLNVDFTQAERIQEALLDFKASGKPIWAHANSYSQATYVLSIAADRVLMDPMGSLVLSGVSSSTSYYKDLLTKLKIDVDVHAEGQYKSAVEPFTRSDMSEQTRMVQTNLVEQLWKRMQQRVVGIRGIGVSELNAYTSNLHEIAQTRDVSLANIAVSHGLVDALVSTSELSDEYRESLGKTHKSIKFYDYLPYAQPSPNTNPSKIAVVVIEGSIFSVDSQLAGQQAGWVRQIKRVRNNKNYKGLVLRINSPGGSVFESENIRRELIRYKKTDRPLVASMAGSAASGGYWVAAPADHIFASPVTLTGSIGVFGLMPNFDEALANIGVTNDVIRTTPYGLGNSVMVRPTDEMRSINQHSVNQFYGYFLNIVAEARNMSLENVENIAQGRVWLGQEAVDLNLIDAIGEIDAAIAKTADLAGISIYDVEYIQPQSDTLTPFDILITKIHSQVEKMLPISSLFSNFQRQELHYLTDPSNVYASCRLCNVQF